MMRIFALAIFILFAASCSWMRPEPIVRTVEVLIAVPEPCIEQAPVRPVYRFGKGDAPTERDMAKILADDFELAQQYGVAWEAATIGCIKQ